MPDVTTGLKGLGDLHVDQQQIQQAIDEAKRGKLFELLPLEVQQTLYELLGRVKHLEQKVQGLTTQLDALQKEYGDDKVAAGFQDYETKTTLQLLGQQVNGLQGKYEAHQHYMSFGYETFEVLSQSFEKNRYYMPFVWLAADGADTSKAELIKYVQPYLDLTKPPAVKKEE